MTLYLIPFISAAIGWFTNYLAIKMLFHPKEPKQILGFTLQGVFPKRKGHLAQRMGKIVANDLFSMEVIKGKLDNPDTREQIKIAIVNELDDYLRNKFPQQNPMIAMFMSGKLVEQIKEKIADQLDEMVPRVTGKVAAKLDEIDVEQLVTKKVANFSNEKLEEMIMSVIHKELQFVEISGGILGFLIGLMQVGLVMLSEQP